MEQVIRKIIHVDMDAFYASVEQRDNPSLQGRPVAVGGSRERGVVAAASYEARKFGVRSAMPSITAARLCNHLIFVPPRFEVYKDISSQIREVFREYTDLIEPLALDEAYLDVTENKVQLEFAMDIAREIKAKIKDRTGLVASAGISYNKFLAKIASDYNKPDGFYVITPKMAESFIEKLPIEKFFGVGKVTAKKMHDKGIKNGYDLKQKSRSQLRRWFGKAGAYYYNIARGIDNRIVNPDRIRKSLGAENTFSMDIVTKDAVIQKLDGILEVLLKRAEKANTAAKTLTLKVKYADFKQITRSKTEEEAIPLNALRRVIYELVEQVPDIERGIRLLGLSLSNFQDEEDDSDTFLGQLEIDF